MQSDLGFQKLFMGAADLCYVNMLLYEAFSPGYFDHQSETKANAADPLFWALLFIITFDSFSFLIPRI